MSATRVNEGAGQQLTGSILDAAGAAVSAASITSARLTLYDVETYEPDGSPVAGIINARNAVELLAESPVGITLSDGAFAFTLEPADNIIVTPRRQVERHRAEFVFEYPSGSSTMAIEIEVINLRSQG